MDLKLILDWAALFGGMVGFAGLLNTLRAQRRQSNAQIFLAYTKRFDEIMEKIGPENFRAQIEIATPIKDMSPALLEAADRYLNLCCEEHYLCSQGFLTKSVWWAWEQDICNTLKCPLFRTLWSDRWKKYGSYNSGFVRYITDLHAGQQPRKPWWRRRRRYLKRIWAEFRHSSRRRNDAQPWLPQPGGGRGPHIER